MLNRILFVLLLSLSMVSDALAEIKRVAVLEFRGVDIDAPVLLKLSDQSRTAAVDILSTDEYLIMTRENMMQVLDDMGLDASCMEGQCEVEIGRNIQADVIVTGDLLKMDTVYVLTLKLYDTGSGALLSSLDVEETDLLNLKKQTYAQSKILFQKGLGLSVVGTNSVDIASGFTGTVQTDEWMVGGANASIVHFESSPSGAVVLVDGQLLCTETPCDKEVPTGAHTVVFQKERYFPYQLTVDPAAQSNISASLEPKFGILSVETNTKGVQVQMDGKSIGATPIRMEVDPGIHSLSIEDPCYIGQEQAYQFQMKSGETENIQYPIAVRESAIAVRAKDKEGNAIVATVKLDGKELGKTPLQEKVPLCSSDLRVSYGTRGHHPKLVLKEREITELDVTFGREQPRIGKATWWASGLMMGASIGLYQTTVQSHASYMASPSMETYQLNRRAHNWALVLSTVSTLWFVTDWVEWSEGEES